MILQGQRYEVKEVNVYDGGELEDLRIENFGNVEHYVMVMKNDFEGYKSRIMQEVDGVEGEWDNLHLGFIEKENGVIKITKVEKVG